MRLPLWKKALIEGYAGHPVQVSINVFLMTIGGILFGHYALNATIAGPLVFGALVPPLVAVLAGSWMKMEEKPGRRRGW